MTNCPSRAILESIDTEAIDKATFAGIEEHVEQCPDCQQILEAMTQAMGRTMNSDPDYDVLPTLPGLVIEGKLGQGGANAVYLARDPMLKRHVAVKLFHRNSVVDPHAREHWLSEARALSHVSHDHVVAIYRVDESEEWLWLVIEYVSGGTLKQRLTEPLAPRDAARLMETIARTVGTFHARGMCHLDLKPSNILLGSEPGASWDTVSPKISDFGIARLEGEPGTTATGANGPKGTPSYMAPEQVAALPGTIGASADIHAMGAIMYHLLTGRPPFQGESSAYTLELVRNHDPVPPRRLNGRIPRDLETICLKCLEKAPARRYRSALALADDLQLWLNGRPIKARRVSLPGHAWRWCRRHPAVAGLLVTLAMTVATGVVGLFVLLKQVEAERSRLSEARRNAEAYEKFSASAANQLDELVRMTHAARPGAAPGRIEESILLQLRTAISDFKSRGIVSSSSLGVLELSVGNALNSGDTIEAGRSLLFQSVTDLKQSLANNPDDKLARFWLLRSLYSLGCVAEGSGQLEDALNWYEQAAAVLTKLSPAESDGVILIALSQLSKTLGNRLGQSGRTEREERLRRINRSLRRYLFGSDPAGSTDTIPPTLATLRRVFERQDLQVVAKSELNRYVYDGFVAGWLAISIGPLNPFCSSSTAATYDNDPDAGAIALISAIRDRCLKLGLADSVVPAVVGSFWQDAAKAAHDQRRLGRVDEADATAVSLMALARRFVREYPDSADSHRLLSEACNQIRKNAIQTNNQKVVREYLVEAIQAGRRAVSLAPDRVDNRENLDTLTARLATLEAERKAAASSRPSQGDRTDKGP